MRLSFGITWSIVAVDFIARKLVQHMADESVVVLFNTIVM